VGKQNAQLSLPLQIVVQNIRKLLAKLCAHCHNLQELEDPITILCV
jgi:hypothetical protein